MHALSERTFGVSHVGLMRVSSHLKQESLVGAGADIVPRLLGASLDRVHSTIGSYFQILQYFTAVRLCRPLRNRC